MGHSPLLFVFLFRSAYAIDRWVLSRSQLEQRAYDILGRLPSESELQSSGNNNPPDVASLVDLEISDIWTLLSRRGVNVKHFTDARAAAEELVNVLRQKRKQIVSAMRMQSQTQTQSQRPSTVAHAPEGGKDTRVLSSGASQGQTTPAPPSSTTAPRLKLFVSPQTSSASAASAVVSPGKKSRRRRRNESQHRSQSSPRSADQPLQAKNRIVQQPPPPLELPVCVCTCLFVGYCVRMRRCVFTCLRIV